MTTQKYVVKVTYKVIVEAPYPSVAEAIAKEDVVSRAVKSGVTISGAVKSKMERLAEPLIVKLAEALKQ